jgi:hypothetical protein
MIEGIGSGSTKCVVKNRMGGDFVGTSLDSCIYQLMELYVYWGG